MTFIYFINKVMSVFPLSDVKAPLPAKNNHTGPEIRDTLYDTTEEEL